MSAEPDDIGAIPKSGSEIRNDADVLAAAHRDVCAIMIAGRDSGRWPDVIGLQAIRDQLAAARRDGSRDTLLLDLAIGSTISAVNRRRAGLSADGAWAVVDAMLAAMVDGR